MKSNEKFSQYICNILKEAAEEKMETASQEDPEPEETIFQEDLIHLIKMSHCLKSFTHQIGKENYLY